MGQRMGRGGMMGMMGQTQIPPEKQEAFNALLEAHQAEMTPLQDAMWAKHTELRALAANPNTKPETIQSLIKELTNLRAQMRSKQEAFRAKVKSELGITLPHGMMGGGMMGPGMMGGGMMGPGMMGGGMMGPGMMMDKDDVPTN
ncbi:MAG TPA: zinc resistance protein [Desulfomicrobiaceae bacterium]|nr:zinc resistance protein [Desulfomicrobiaceae bacterium]